MANLATIQFAIFTHDTSNNSLNVEVNDVSTGGYNAIKHTFAKPYVAGDRVVIKFDNTTKMATFYYGDDVEEMESFTYECLFNPSGFGTLVQKMAGGVAPAIYGNSDPEELGVYETFVSGFNQLLEDVSGGFPGYAGLKCGDYVKFTNDGVWDGVNYKAGQYAVIRDVPTKKLITLSGNTEGGGGVDDIVVTVPTDFPNCKAAFTHYASLMKGKSNKVFLAIEENYTLSSSDTLTIAEKYLWLHIVPANPDVPILSDGSIFIAGQFGGAIGGINGDFKYVYDPAVSPERFVTGFGFSLGNCFYVKDNTLKGLNVMDWPNGGYNVTLQTDQDNFLLLEDNYTSAVDAQDFNNNVNYGGSIIEIKGGGVEVWVNTNRSITVAGNMGVRLFYHDYPELNGSEYTARRINVRNSSSSSTTIAVFFSGSVDLNVSAFYPSPLNCILAAPDGGAIVRAPEIYGTEGSKIRVRFGQVPMSVAGISSNLVNIRGHACEIQLDGQPQGSNQTLSTKYNINGTNIRLIDQLDPSGNGSGDYGFEFTNGLYYNPSGLSNGYLAPNTIDDESGISIQAPRSFMVANMGGQMLGIDNPILDTLDGSIVPNDSYLKAFKRLQNRALAVDWPLSQLPAYSGYPMCVFQMTGTTHPGSLNNDAHGITAETGALATGFVTTTAEPTFSLGSFSLPAKIQFSMSFRVGYVYQGGGGSLTSKLDSRIIIEFNAVPLLFSLSSSTEGTVLKVTSLDLGENIFAGIGLNTDVDNVVVFGYNSITHDMVMYVNGIEAFLQKTTLYLGDSVAKIRMALEQTDEAQPGISFAAKFIYTPFEPLSDYAMVPQHMDGPLTTYLPSGVVGPKLLQVTNGAVYGYGGFKYCQSPSPGVHQYGWLMPDNKTVIPLVTGVTELRLETVTDVIPNTETVIPHGLQYTPTKVTLQARSADPVWESADADAINIYIKSTGVSAPFVAFVK